MIKHIVLFKLKDFEKKEEKDIKINQIRMGLLNLKNIIKEIESIEVGINENSKETYDLALISTHKSWEALAVYDQHPTHVAVKKIIKEVLDTRAAADIEY